MSSAATAGTFPTAAVLAVGAELLAGEIVNGNAAVLGEALAGVGIRVVRSSMVGDDEADIAAAVLDLAAHVQIIVVCGGLGPTQDDRTREGLARAAGVPMEHSAELAQELRARLGQIGEGIPAINLRQADIPRGASSLHNPVGTAPGVRLTLGDRLIYALPGVPHELTAMLHDSVLPDIRATVPGLPVVVRETVRTIGLWESAVAEAMAPEVARTAGTPEIAFLAAQGETRVVVTGQGADLAAAHALVAPSVAFARRVLGPAVYDAESLQAEVVGLLTTAGRTVACAESLTAGLLAATIADVPGSSAVLRGGIVAYATDLKAELLGVSADVLASDGAVSVRTAAAMAQGVARACTADYGLALTGVAGPGSQEGHPPGTVAVALHGPGPSGPSEFRLLTFPGGRAQVRRYAVTAALSLLRGALVEH